MIYFYFFNAFGDFRVRLYVSLKALYAWLRSPFVCASFFATFLTIYLWILFSSRNFPYLLLGLLLLYCLLFHMILNLLLKRSSLSLSSIDFFKSRWARAWTPFSNYSASPARAHALAWNYLSNRARAYARYPKL